MHIREANRACVGRFRNSTLSRRQIRWRRLAQVVRPDEQGITIQVIDQGYGISAEHLDRLFEHFYRVDKARSRNQGGTGLGLAIVKHVVQLHDGEVSAQSMPGEGSIFTIKLPSS